MAGSSPTQVAEDDVRLPDGRALHVYDRAGPNGRRAVVWHHGTPNVGLPPEPLFPIADRLGIRFVSYDRPGYGGSDPDPGRSVGSAAVDVRVIVDALGIERFGTIGHSGGGPHALACAALLPERVTGAVSVAGLAPFGAEALDWFAGMAPAGAAALAAAAEGRDAKMRFEASAGSDEPGFTGSDWAALEGRVVVVRPGRRAGPCRREGRTHRRRHGLRRAVGVRPCRYRRAHPPAARRVRSSRAERAQPVAGGAMWLCRTAPGAG